MIICETQKKYIEEYKLYHKTPRGRGDSYEKCHKNISELVNSTNSKTLLDFGCGRGEQYSIQNLHESWGYMPELYDPAVKGIDRLPTGKFDGIYSTDVMEHIPEKVIPDVLDYIYSHANKFVYLGICTAPAKAILSNGENAHCTVKPIEWWTNEIKKHTPVYTHLRCYGKSNGYVIIKT